MTWEVRARACAVALDCLGDSQMRLEIGIHTVHAALQHLSLWPFHWQACASFTHDVDHWPLLVNSWRVPEYLPCRQHYGVHDAQTGVCINFHCNRVSSTLQILRGVAGAVLWKFHCIANPGPERPEMQSQINQ